MDMALFNNLHETIMRDVDSLDSTLTDSEKLSLCSSLIWQIHMQLYDHIYSDVKDEPKKLKALHDFTALTDTLIFNIDRIAEKEVNTNDQ